MPAEGPTATWQQVRATSGSEARRALRRRSNCGDRDRAACAAVRFFLSQKRFKIESSYTADHSLRRASISLAAGSERLSFASMEASSVRLI
jgi:hypothetical protein